MEYIKNQTFDVCKIAILKNPLAISHIRIRDYELCKLALKLDYNVIKVLPFRSEAMRKFAFEKAEEKEKSYELLEYVNDVTEDICITMIKKYGAVSFHNIFRIMITDKIIKCAICVCGKVTFDICDAYYVLINLQNT